MSNTRCWTEWTSALAWAEALTEWDLDNHPTRWPQDPGARRAELATVMLLLGYAIQSAARTTGIRAASPNELRPLRLALIHACLDVTVARGLLLYTDGSLGPGGDQPGQRELGLLIQACEQPDRWRALVAQTAGIITGHLLVSAEQPDSTVLLGDRYDALVQLHRRWAAERLGEIFSIDDY